MKDIDISELIKHDSYLYKLWNNEPLEPGKADISLAIKLLEYSDGDKATTRKTLIKCPRTTLKPWDEKAYSGNEDNTPLYIDDVIEKAENCIKRNKSAVWFSQWIKNPP